jgi:hypothetical protein
MTTEEILRALGERFGVLADSDTRSLTVLARNGDVAVGDLFLLPCRRGPSRFYLFRTTRYANVMNRTLEMNDVARSKLTMPDSYLAQDLAEELLIQLEGVVLGYAEQDAAGGWALHRPRRLPSHLTDVYRVGASPAAAAAVRDLIGSQLGTGDLAIGELLAGERSLPGVAIQLPVWALSHHLGVFGRTGCGKSNLMMVLLRSVMAHNRRVLRGESRSLRGSILAIDPHDEFRTWHSANGGADGLRGIVGRWTDEERRELAEPFYYLTARDVTEPLERRVRLSRGDLTPEDLLSIMEFSEQQAAFANQYFGQHGELWISRLLAGDVNLEDHGEAGTDYLPGTVFAVQRRVGALRHGHTRVFTRFDPEAGYRYDSTLPDLVCALEQGRVVAVDTTLMSEAEQFLLTTVVARVLFSLRRALRSATDADSLRGGIRQALGNDDQGGQVGLRTLADELEQRLESGQLPYLETGRVRAPAELPHVNVVVEEAPSILNPDRMRFGSVFRDISRQGRKFGIGLTVVSQQVTEIDKGILTQINTELTMSLGNEDERRAAIQNASADLRGFEQELQVLGRGQAVMSASYREMPLPLAVPDFDR